MYTNKPFLYRDAHFQHHLEASVPVLIYLEETEIGSGLIVSYNATFIKIGDTYYNRLMYTFVSK
ncbi:hypothetical protein B5M42_016290 [Paenibacillus athensensis]|uniref:Uncharacterized protein n=1 Tax=Paenibacillus athensensis TaxID=1967502 RepID=A0A4Y8QAE6_9BACL|nr:hypothetical protein [Paenibacillus athensensis]MCD1260373.1 hypothetical protein [Paenibacillus athensensis]